MHSIRAQLLCKESVHRYCAQYDALRPPVPPDRDVRRPHRHPPRRRQPARAGPPAALAPARPPLRIGGPATATDLAADAGHQLRRHVATTCASSRRSAWSSDTGEGEGKRRLWRAATDFHSYYPSDFAGDEDSETALNWLARDYVRHFAEQAERWLDASPDLAGRRGRTPAAAATTWSCSPPSS